MTSPAEALDGRIIAIDAVRGVAVCGILLMNIVSFGMPGFAYVDPTIWGWHSAADHVAWLANYVMSDGKFRALFTMLFGASMALIAERAAAHGASPAKVHYRRMVWLFAIGMLHAWLFWYGDILVQYAVAGMIGFAMWRWPPRALWTSFALMMAAQSLLNYGHYVSVAPVRATAIAPGASPAAVRAWRDVLTNETSSHADAVKEVAAYRGSLVDVFNQRAKTAWIFQTFLLPLTLPEVFAFMAFGIAMWRNGFLKGTWTTRAYGVVIVVGYGIAAPLTLLLGLTILRASFDPVIMIVTDTASFWLRPSIALSHAAVVVLAVKQGIARGLTDRLAAAGRMAFSNYLGTTLIATTLFYGYGFGLFGALDRAQLYVVVAAIWAAILLWSKRWLVRFNYGPFEWLWRSLARGTLQPFRRQIRPKP